MVPKKHCGVRIWLWKDGRNRYLNDSSLWWIEKTISYVNMAKVVSPFRKQTLDCLVIYLKKKNFIFHFTSAYNLFHFFFNVSLVIIVEICVKISVCFLFRRVYGKCWNVNVTRIILSFREQWKVLLCLKKTQWILTLVKRYGDYYC